MDIKCLGSSSSGNCFVIEMGGKSLMVECGFKWGDIVRKCTNSGIDLTKIKYCAITHGHSDHECGAYMMMKDGIDVVCSKSCFEQIAEGKNISKLLGKFVDIEDCQRVSVGGFEITAFAVHHDFPDSLGYYIRSADTGESVVFINDCAYVDYDLSSFHPDCIMVECNYVDKFLHIELYNAIKKLDDKSVKRYKRILEYHMALSGTRKILSNVSLDKVKSVILMHLSDKNANEYTMKSDISDFMSHAMMHKCFVGCAGADGGIK